MNSTFSRFCIHRAESPIVAASGCPPQHELLAFFDQYNQPENRLTHALAVCLNEDRNLLRGFLAWMSVKAPVHETKLLIAEQSVPGDPAEFDEGGGGAQRFT